MGTVEVWEGGGGGEIGARGGEVWAVETGGT